MTVTETTAYSMSSCAIFHVFTTRTSLLCVNPETFITILYLHYITDWRNHEEITCYDYLQDVRRSNYVARQLYEGQCVTGTQVLLFFRFKWLWHPHLSLSRLLARKDCIRNVKHQAFTVRWFVLPCSGRFGVYLYLLLLSQYQCTTLVGNHYVDMWALLAMEMVSVSCVCEFKHVK